MGQIFPKVFLHFMISSLRIETNDALQCSSDSFPHMLIHILCVQHFDADLSRNCEETVLQCEKIAWTQDLRVQHMNFSGSNSIKKNLYNPCALLLCIMFEYS